MNIQKHPLAAFFKKMFTSREVLSTGMVWVMVAGVCAVLANVIAAAIV